MSDRRVEVCVMPTGWTGIVVPGPGGFVPKTEENLSVLYAAPNSPVWVEVQQFNGQNHLMHNARLIFILSWMKRVKKSPLYTGHPD